jgi:hypothetical protein
MVAKNNQMRLKILAGYWDGKQVLVFPPGDRIDLKVKELGAITHDPEPADICAQGVISSTASKRRQQGGYEAYSCLPAEEDG